MTSFNLAKMGQKPPFSVFVALTVFLFFCALSAADSIGFVPYYIDGTAPSVSAPSQNDLVTTPSAAPAQNDTAVTSIIVPTHISIPAAGIDLPVQNPSTRNIDTLDALLQSGPARYVDSATLGQAGNVLIFAHSSHLPIVHNQMFRAFNNIPDLKAGDSITLTGDDGSSYLYRVTSVRKANADDAIIDLSPSIGTKLTLVTCDTLTSKSARFILEADFVGRQ
ncbi:sortase [Candidatus Kaiserbacteria bacterium]|nr:sortase [Candidatus Kaiserbacteria bacterium]